jgi:hypothetical protein
MLRFTGLLTQYHQLGAEISTSFCDKYSCMFQSAENIKELMETKRDLSIQMMQQVR